MSSQIPFVQKAALLIVTLSMTCVCSVGSAGLKPVEVLQTSLVDTLLSDRARNAVVQALKQQSSGFNWDAKNVSLEILVGLDQYVLTKEVQNEIALQLQRVGLSFSLNQNEILAYRFTGRVPPISNESRIGRLSLTPMAFFALRSEGIETVQQMSRMSKLADAKATPASASPQTPTALDLPFAGLSTRTLDALLRHGIKDIVQLASMTEHELKFVHRLGAQGVEEIRELFHEKGLPWYRDKLEKALAEKLEDAPLDIHFGIPWRLTEHWQVTTLKQLLERLDSANVGVRAGGQISQTALRFKAIVDQYRAKICADQLSRTQKTL